MFQVDPTPPKEPTEAELREALQKGLGRAVLWAEKGQWSDKAPLLNACLNDQRYDRQCEESRGEWLWRIMAAVGAIQDFREPILSALDQISDGLAAQQLCEFCVLYARAGDDRFRVKLREIVSRKPDPSCPWLGEEDLISLESAEGFLFAAEVRGESLKDRDWEWDDGTMIDTASGKLGEAVVASLLEREAVASTAIRRFQSKWLGSITPRGASLSSHLERMRQYSLNDVISAVEGGGSLGGLLRGWGMYAEESDLRAIQARLFECMRPDDFAKYLRVFSNRPFPEFDVRVLDFLGFPDPEIQRRTYAALAPNAHPAIRRYALDHVAQQINDDNFLMLFINNFEPGDEDLISANLILPRDPDECHSLMSDVIKILEKNPAAHLDRLGMYAYYATPCGHCRHDAVKLLVERNSAAPWLIEECEVDAFEETRKLIASRKAK